MPQQILLDLISKRVSEEFGLDSAYTVTGFNSKTMTVTLSCVNYELSIKLTGRVRDEIFEKYLILKKQQEQIEDEE